MLPSVYELMAQDCIMYALPLSSSPFWGSSSWDNWISESSFLKLLAVSTLHLFKLFKHLSSFNSITRKVKKKIIKWALWQVLCLCRECIFMWSLHFLRYISFRELVYLCSTQNFISKNWNPSSAISKGLCFSPQEAVSKVVSAGN